jgi:hypothetical protein
VRISLVLPRGSPPHPELILSAKQGVFTTGLDSDDQFVYMYIIHVPTGLRAMSTPARIAQPLSRVAPKTVCWLWEPYLPRGKLALLDGDPDVGKSLLSIDLAARLSRGGPLPDGTPLARPHTTLLLSAEDGSADTIRPRAEAAGADLDRVIIDTSADGSLMRFPADAGQLEAMIREHAADLVVIDPVMAFLPPEVASNTDQCVRGVLSTLAGLAARTDCTILLIRHLRKKDALKAIHRGLGSIGIIGAVRAGLLLAHHPAAPEVRVLAVTKSNLARTPPALGLRIRWEDAARVSVEWAGRLDVTADGLGLPVTMPLRPRDRATEWLFQQLASGPRRAMELFTAAAEVGIPEATLKRAKAELRVQSHRVSAGGINSGQEWFWYDPAASWPANAPFRRPRSLLETLPPLDPL